MRLRGFAARASLEEAQAWADAQGAALGAEEVDVATAAGRVLAIPVAAPRDLPPADRAGEDGWAVRAADAEGASAYNPVPLRRADGAGALPAGAAALVAAGDPLPPGADAVLPFEAVQAAGAAVEAVAVVPAGAGVERAGQRLRAGAPLGAPGRPLRAHEAALLAALGIARVHAVRRPRVRLLVAGPRGAGEGEAHLPMLRALVERDGGHPEPWAAGSELGPALRRAAEAPGADLLLVTGRTGTGADDVAPLALAAAGRLELHGVALRPGGSTALGRAGGLPAALLPGDPLACLCTYELLAGRLVRRLGGRAPGLPHAAVRAPLGRKLVSSVGVAEVFPVRLEAGRALPLGLSDLGGLPAAAGADGFTVVPAALEGFPEGAPVTVHLY